jgi:hypothetical protein
LNKSSNKSVKKQTVEQTVEPTVEPTEYSQITYKYPKHWDMGYVPDWAKYQAVDEDGKEYFYEFKPIPCGNGKWLPSGGRCLIRHRKISNWRETLSERKTPAEMVIENRKSKRVKEGRGRPKKKKERVQRKPKPMSLETKTEGLGIFRNTDGYLNNYLKRYVIVYTTVNGKKLYCRGNTQNCHGEYSYKFTDIRKKVHPKLKYYTSSHYARKAIETIVEVGEITASELSVEMGVYEKVNGEFVKSREGTRLYSRYLSMVEKHKLEKENRKNERVESSIGEEEEND